MLKGIDVSHHQRGIKSFGTDVDFVITKATEGIGYTDEECDRLYQLAKSSGKKLGVYHFARPDLGNSGKDEADWFLKETKGYWNEALLILDWEPAGDYKKNVAWAKEWLDRVYEVTKVKPLIYMSASVIIENDWSSVASADYGLWVANYGVNDGVAHEEVFNKYPLQYWEFYALWQFTSKGRIEGYRGNVDLNYFSGDNSSWDKYANTSSKPELKSNEEIAEEVLKGKWGNYPEREIRLEQAGYNYEDIQEIVNYKLYGVKPEFRVGDYVEPIENVDYRGVHLIRYDEKYQIKAIDQRGAVLGAVRPDNQRPTWAVLSLDNIRKI